MKSGRKEHILRSSANNEVIELSEGYTVTTCGVIDRVWREGDKEDGQLWVEYTNVPSSPLDDFFASLSPEEKEQYIPLQSHLLPYLRLLPFRPTLTVKMAVPPIEYEPKVGDALTIVADEATVVKWRLRDGPWLPWRDLWENGQLRLTPKQEKESE